MKRCAPIDRALLPCLLAALAGLASCTLVAPPQPMQPAAPTASDAAFEALADRYLAQMLPLTPLTATALGEHRYDSQLDDVSAAGYARRAGLAHELLTKLQELDFAKMTRPHQVDARLLRTELEHEIWSVETLNDWRWNPLIYTELTGNTVYLLMARDFAPLPDRLRNVTARLNELPRLLSQAREVLEPARVPRIHAETAVKQNTGVLSLIDQLVVPQLGVLPEADQLQLKAAIAHARTAVTQQQLWLEKKLLPNAQGDFRLGTNLYDTALRFALDSPLSRQEIRTRAQAELLQTRSRMYEVARTVLTNRPGAPPTPSAPTPDQQQAAIAAALELAYQERPPRELLFDTVHRAYDDAVSFVKTADLVTVYDDPLEIVPMPEFQRGVALAYCDPPGPLDKGQKTFYSVAPIPADWTTVQVNSFLREYNSRSIADLTAHEAMPGHYLQLQHANRYQSPLRSVLASGTFIEGWAVYAERLMVEQGFHNRDPLMQLIQLKWYLRAIANSILDQAVHTEGMSREDAMRLMMHDTFQEEREAAGKWTRVQLTAAQLPTYFVGVQEHLALRDEARTRWGKEFTLKRYHDTVLSFGSPPVRYVRELMFDLPIE